MTSRHPRLHQTLTGALATGAGALLWITGGMSELGGHRAVGLMATHANAIQTTNSIAFTIGTITAAFALAASAIGTGMLAFAAGAPHSGHHAWATGTVVIALVLLATAGSHGTGNDNLSDLMLFATGIAALPTSLIWTSRIGRTGDAPQNHPDTRQHPRRTRWTVT